MVKVWIRCLSCERVDAKRAAHVGKHGCSLCANKTELKLYKFLKSHVSNITHQARFEWSAAFRYDFCVDDKVLIELDGPQHFRPISSWKSGFETGVSDKKKEDLALEAGYHVIRLLQEDVYEDRNDWQEFLTTTMAKCLIASPSVHHPNRREYTGGVYARLRLSQSFF